MTRLIWSAIRRWLAGGKLARAVARNDAAADELDRALREVLKG